MDHPPPFVWRCDYCINAHFPTYEEAERHERTCPDRLNDAHNGAREEQVIGRVVNVIEDDRVSPLPAATTSTTPVRAAASTTTAWICDVCLVYKSTDYDEVVEHEKKCKVAADAKLTGDVAGALSLGGSAKPKTSRDETTAGVSVGAIVPAPAASNAEKAEKSSSDGDVVMNDMRKSKEQKSKSPKRTKWRCDVCFTAIFDTFQEAEEHEKNCTGAKNAEGEDGNEDGVVVVKKNKRAKKGQKEDAINEMNVANEIVNTLVAKHVMETGDKSPKIAATKKNISNEIVNKLVTKHVMETSNKSPKQLIKPSKIVASSDKSPKKQQSKSNETALVDSLAIKTSKMPVNKSVKGDAPQRVDTNPGEATLSMEEEIQTEPVPEKESKSEFSTVLKTALLMAPLAIVMMYLPPNIISDHLPFITLPSYAVLAASPLLLILLSYTTFGLAMAITHQGIHHHTSRGFVLDIFIALRDTIAPPTIDYVNWDNDEPTPTLREYLSHEDGFSMAFCPAFFGFFAYFGALSALEEETKCIVPKLNNGKVECGLKSVAGASAGAMAAVMLAAGIQPHVAAEYVCKFNWSMVADPPGLGGLVKGNKFEEFMRSFIKEAAARETDKDGDVMLEDALVPVAVSGFDLLRMRGTIMSNGCMAKAARSSAGFPGLFQPVSWNKDGKKLLIDGGIRDGLGLNGLSAFPSNSNRGLRIINMAVGDYGMSGSNGLKDLPSDVQADSLVSIAIVNTPMCGPWAMANGPRAVESARKAMASVLDTPLERGTSKNHFVLRVDASKWLE